MSYGTLRTALWRRYATVLTVMLAGALLALGGIEMSVAYRNTLSNARAAQQQTAAEVAFALRQSLGVVERQLASVATLPWQHGEWLGLDQRLEEFHRLLLLMPTLVEIRLLDANLRTVLRASRANPDERISRPAVAAGRTAPDAASELLPEGGVHSASSPVTKVGETFVPRFDYGPVHYVAGYEPQMALILRLGDRTAGFTAEDSGTGDFRCGQPSGPRPAR
jgi:hypothetical protein